MTSIPSEPPIEEGVSYMSEKNILSTQVTMCKEHTWRKYSEIEIACIYCPTINIVDGPDKYIVL